MRARLGRDAHDVVRPGTKRRVRKLLRRQHPATEPLATLGVLHGRDRRGQRQRGGAEDRDTAVDGRHAFSRLDLNGRPVPGSHGDVVRAAPVDDRDDNLLAHVEADRLR